LNSRIHSEFWHGRVRITQIPASNDYFYQEEVDDGPRIDERKSWMCDPFMDHRVYGTIFKNDPDFSWEFFCPAPNSNEAFVTACVMLNYFKMNFPGLDGTVRVMRLGGSDIYARATRSDLYEVEFPEVEMKATTAFLIERFINMCEDRSMTLPIAIYMVWARVNKYAYKVRVFLACDGELYDGDRFNANYLEWRAFLESMRLQVRNGADEPGELRFTPGSLMLDVLRGKHLFTGNDREGIEATNALPWHYEGGFFNPIFSDFTILDTFPLPRAAALPVDNAWTISNVQEGQKSVLIGNYVNVHGVPTKFKKYVPVDNFAQSAIIAGNPGTGKTYLLRQLVTEFSRAAPHVGIMILNLAKPNQEKTYGIGRVITYGSEEFRIPYFFEGPFLEQSLQESATYLVASVGLKNIVEKNMHTVMKSYYYQQGLPRSLKILFDNLERFFKQNPYHHELQTNLLRAIHNRILSLLSDPVLIRTMELISEIPSWIRDWLAGENCYVDLSACNVYVKRLLTNAIFQMVRTLLSASDVNQLKYLIVIDEAHQVLQKVLSRNADDDETVAREQLERIFTTLLQEFRSKGLAFLLAENFPSQIFDCCLTLPSVKFLFNMGSLESSLFTKDVTEQKVLAVQKNRQALLFNGVTGERYAFHTINA
jgi:hypothetical protein